MRSLLLFLLLSLSLPVIEPVNAAGLATSPREKPAAAGHRHRHTCSREVWVPGRPLRWCRRHYRLEMDIERCVRGYFVREPMACPQRQRRKRPSSLR